MPFLTVPKQKFGMFVKSAQPLRGGKVPAQNVPAWAQSAPLQPTPLNILRTITEPWNAWYNARLALRAQLKKFPYLKPKKQKPIQFMMGKKRPGTR